LLMYSFSYVLLVMYARRLLGQDADSTLKKR